MTIVCKFGGTSCADAGQIQKVAAILKENKDRKYLIVSAPGKRFAGDEKVTDLLYKLYDARKEEKERERLLEKIQERYAEIILDLHVSFDLENEIDEIRRHLIGDNCRDYCISRGEYLNAKILSAYLNWPFVDSAECFFFDHNRRFMTGISCRFLARLLKPLEHAVLPGFYGSDEEGNIVTFPRGGSDITGAACAKAVKADVYENWTDVNGILAADPRIVDHPKQIHTITYEELRELSYMGASVLQEDAVFPVRSAGIPIHILNTNDPQNPGTMITSKRVSEKGQVITGIAGKTGISNIQIEKAMMNSEVGFGAKVLNILARYGVSYEHTPTSIDTMSVLVPTIQLKECRQALLRDMDRLLEPDRLFIEDGIALIAVVGQGIAGKLGFAARLLKVISDAQVNIRMIDVGFSEMNIILGVDEKNYKKTIQTIYTEMSDLF